MSNSVFLIKHAEGWVTENHPQSFETSACIYDAKRYTRLGNALRVMKDLKAEKVVEVAEDNFHDWRGDYFPNDR